MSRLILMTWVRHIPLSLMVKVVRKLKNGLKNRWKMPKLVRFMLVKLCVLRILVFLLKLRWVKKARLIPFSRSKNGLKKLKMLLMLVTKLRLNVLKLIVRVGLIRFVKSLRAVVMKACFTVVGAFVVATIVMIVRNGKVHGR